jgi:hypothetical protein
LEEWEMRLKFIGCRVFCREVAYLTYNSKTVVDADFLRQGLHDTPEKLNTMLQSEIDKTNAEASGGSMLYNNAYDAIVLGYGLCSNAIIGLRSGAQTLVVPKVHDCVSLLLGSRETYKEYFDANNGGVYWYSCGWLEHSLMPSRERVEFSRERYIERYGEEDAEALLEMELDWMKKYKLCAYINWPELDNPEHRAYSRECAKYLGWDFKEFTGSDKLLRDMLEGRWDEKYFLVVPPGNVVKPCWDENIIGFEKE